MLTKFIKQLIGNFIVVGLLLLLGYLFPPNPTHVLVIEVLQWEIQISFWCAAIIIILLRLVVICVLELLAFLSYLPTKLKEYKKVKQLQYETSKLSEAIMYLISGDVEHSYNMLTNEKFEYLEEPANNIIVGSIIFKNYPHIQEPLTYEHKCTKPLNILYLLLRNIDLPSSYEYIKKLLDYFPRSKFIYTIALDWAEKQKDYKKFLDIADKAIAKNILDTKNILYNRLEQLCINQTLELLKTDPISEEARTILEWTIKHINNHESSSMLLALLYAQDDNLKKAKQTLIKAWVNKPSINIVNQFLYIYNKSSPDERIRKLELLLEHHPHNSYVYEAIIFEALSKNDYQLAEEYFSFIDHINESINKSLLEALMVTKNFEIKHILSKIWQSLHQYNNFSLSL